MDTALCMFLCFPKLVCDDRDVQEKERRGMDLKGIKPCTNFGHRNTVEGPSVMRD